MDRGVPGLWWGWSALWPGSWDFRRTTQKSTVPSGSTVSNPGFGASTPSSPVTPETAVAAGHTTC